MDNREVVAFVVWPMMELDGSTTQLCHRAITKTGQSNHARTGELLLFPGLAEPRNVSFYNMKLAHTAVPLRTVAGALLLTLSFSLWVSAADQPALTGTYTVDNTDGKLGFVRAVKGTAFDEPATVIVFSQKDASKQAKPDDSAMFGKLGNALVVTISADGSIVGTEVIHSKLKAPVSSSGDLT